MKLVREQKPELSITVVDDGDGWPQSLEPVERAFEKGVTTTDGSGLGLYHVKQVIERLGGIVEAHSEPFSEELKGARLGFTDSIMKLEFSLLVVDDQPENINQAIQDLEEHLETKGFTLKREIVKEPNEQHIQELAQSEGKNYDLVMVDYKLGEGIGDGAVVARRLRQLLPYVDMVFFSGAPVRELLSQLSEHSVSGVFAQTRQELGDTLSGLADTVIGKVVDVTHMRGIAMAEIAEMDVLMEETLINVFQFPDTQIINAEKRTIQKLRKRISETPNRFDDYYERHGLTGVIQDSSLFSFANKYQAIIRVAKYLPREGSAASGLPANFDQDIIQNRNMLAHAKESTTGDGQTVLHSKIPGKAKVEIDEDWMSGFRKKILEHRSALDIVCNALREQYSTREPASNFK